MIKKHFITIVSVSAVLTGCQTREEPPPKPQEFTHVPVFVAAGAIPGDSQEKVLYDSQVRAYAVGRYIDPNNRTVMHEQHTVYRVEQMPQWNLMPQPDADPVLLAQRQQQERYANALSGQLTLAVQDMEAARNAVMQVSEQQAGQQEKTAEILEKIKDIEKQYGTVSESAYKSSDTLKKLETDVRKLQKENEIMRLQLKRQRELKNDEK